MTTFAEEDWSESGLAGTLVATDAPPGPAVLIIPGSGPTDRNGNGAGVAAGTYRLLAESLAVAGIRSLRFDKRGVGASLAQKPEPELRFDDFVADAVTAAESLARRSDVTRLLLAGHSEGGLIALAATAPVKASGIILLATPGRPLADLLREQLGTAVTGDLRTTALSILDRLVAGEFVADVPPELAAVFRPSVQPYLLSSLAFDPSAEFAQLSTPALIVQGERDLQVGGADLAALRAARPDATVVYLEDANHVFKIVGNDRAANLAAYGDPSLPLHPGLAPAIMEFVRGVG